MGWVPRWLAGMLEMLQVLHGCLERLWMQLLIKLFLISSFSASEYLVSKVAEGEFCSLKPPVHQLQNRTWGLCALLGGFCILDPVS